MQKLKPSCWPEVRGSFSGRGWSPELHAAAQAVAIFLAPHLPALQRLRLQAREPGAWNGLTPSAHTSLFPSGVRVHLGLLSQENPCGIPLAFPPHLCTQLPSWACGQWFVTPVKSQRHKSDLDSKLFQKSERHGRSLRQLPSP